MNLLSGFKSRSADNERVYVLQELNQLSFAGTSLSGEPRLSDMLDDPVVLSLMRRDGVRADDVAGLVRMKEDIAA